MNVLDEYCKLRNWQGGTIHQVMEDAKTLPLHELDIICGYFTTNEVLYALDDPQNASQLMHIRANSSELITNPI